MKRVLMAAAMLSVGAVASARTAEAYIGEGVQGRPHGGHTAQRMLYYRHGLKVPYRYRHHTH